ncbi:MAG: hypothetical protein A2048_04785 [Deltaproteobacteria bacterium GWA2_45_12]|nr:MAG: hypothetical protein A2048_04785 [Deltaproteobacteria bacterium GWA2_45_12]
MAHCAKVRGKKWSIINGLVVFGLLGYLGCTPKVNDANTLIVGLEAYPQQLDPRLSTEANTSKINHLIYNGLFQINNKLEITPDLALDYQIKNDKDVYVTLKPGIFFHNQEPLTPADVMATYQSLKKNGSPHQQIWDKLEKIEQTGPNSIRFVLKESFAPILVALCFPILPQSVAENTRFTPVGTGPFKFVEKTEGEKIVLERATETELNHPKKIVFRTITDDNLRTLELLKGRIDLVQNSLPTLLIPTLKDLPLSQDMGVNFAYLGLNLKDPILKNPLVRQAINDAIDRESLIRYKINGMAKGATSLLSPQNPYHLNSLTPIPYNPQKAMELLDQAGFRDPDGDGPQMRFKLVYKTSSKKDRIDMALLVASFLRKVGIDVDVRSYEWGTFFRDIRTGHFQMYSLTWVGVTDPDIYYYAFGSSQIPPIGANRGYYENKFLDDLLVKGRLHFDFQTRQSIYNQVQQIIFDDLPIIPLWYENNWVVTQKNVKGYSLRPDAGFQNLTHIVKE